jgi:uncharacterized membrane protein YwzB
MRAWLLLLIPGLALVLLAAHLLHAGLLPVAVAALLLIALLFVRRPWAARTVQVVLAVAVIEWGLTAATLAQLRARHDEPYLRLLLILGGVALLTAVAAALFQHPALRARFGLGSPAAPAGTSVV